MKVGVIGGGLSGLSCASRLQELGVAVTLYDTGKRGPGGRASSRLWRNAPVDHAAQFAEAPALQLLYPDKGHTVGGTRITIRGGPFVRSLGAAVRFSDSSGEVDEVPATYVNAGRITCVTPARNSALPAHVTVSNDGTIFTAFPNVMEREGTYLTFHYSENAPMGVEDASDEVWLTDNSTGPAVGGTEVTIQNAVLHTSTRLSDANFLPGSALKCKFGSVAVSARWDNYGKIMCVSPEAEPGDDEDGLAAGTQVTVYVSNDGVEYVDGNVTFSYYDSGDGGGDGYVEDPLDDEHGANALDDLMTGGNFAGDGRYAYEVVIDSAGTPDTFKWRLNNMASVEYVTGVGITGGEQELSYGVTVSFGATTGHAVGDSWVFNVGSARPDVLEVTTSGNEGAYPSRVPFEGNAELTVRGQNFLPSDGILCKLSDNLTNVEMVFPGHYDTSEQIRCIAPRQDPHPGDGSLPGGRQYTTQRPCFFKDLQVSNDGGVSYSAVSEHARAFYCDVYVSVSGSDFTGEGTPDKPYQSIQRGIDMALDHPRSHYVYKNEGLTGTEMRGASRRGFAHYINRDRVILMTADYTGFGNIGASPTDRAHSRCARAVWCVRRSLRAECAPVC